MARGRNTRASESENETVDTNEIQDNTAEATEGTEPEAGTEAAGHTFNVGDQASVIRGKLRGRKGEVIAFNEGDKTYAVKLDGGTLAVLNAGNLKAPVDSTVSVRALVAALAEFGGQAGTPDEDAAIRLANTLDGIVPGVSVKLHETLAAR